MLDESEYNYGKTGLDRQTLPRRTESQPQPEIYYVGSNLNPSGNIEKAPKPTPRKTTSYHRHPLSLSTETILFNDDKYDPNPIVPNRAPDVPDIWLPMRSVKA